MTYTPTKKLKIAVCVSGGGRSLSNLIKRQGDFPYEIKLVVSSGDSVAANKIASDAGLRLIIEDFSLKNQREAKERLYVELARNEIDLIVLAGFLKLFPVDQLWEGKIINIHPALLPKFGGKGMYGSKVHDAVIAAGERTSGATVHFVSDRYDEGAVIAQTHVDIPKGETSESLASRVFAAECNLLPWVLDQIARGLLPRKNKVAIFTSHGLSYDS